MKKKVITLVLALVLAVSVAFAMVACNQNKAKAEMLDIELSSEQYAFIVKKSDSALLNSVNQFMTEKKTEVQAIIDKYLNATAEQLETFNIGDVATAATGAANELVVATNIDFAPFEYYNGNKIAGIDMEIAKMLAQYLGKTLVIEHMEFDAVVDSVQQLEKYDLGMAALTISDERAEVVNFTAPYFDTTQVLLTKVGDTTFKDCEKKEDVEAVLKTLTGVQAKIGGQAGTTGNFYITGNDSLEFDGYTNLQFNGFSSPSQAVQAMLDGNVGFVILDKAVAESVIKSLNA